MKVRLSPLAASEVQIRAEADADLDDPDVAVVLSCWDGTGLTVPPEKVGQVRTGLTTLSNACDEEWRRLRHSNPSESKANHHASLGLSGACWRMRGDTCS